MPELLPVRVISNDSYSLSRVISIAQCAYTDFLIGAMFVGLRVMQIAIVTVVSKPSNSNDAVIVL